MRILIALNQSQSSDRVMEQITRRTWPKGTSFRLITAIQSSAGFSKKVEEQLHLQAQIYLNEKVIEFQIAFGCDFFIDTKIVDGEVSGCILEESESWHADLIFIGYQNKTNKDQLPCSCVAFKVASLCHCSVEIVKSPVDWRAALEQTIDMEATSHV